MRRRMGWMKTGGIVLVAAAIAAASVIARAGAPIEIGVSARANANASIATNGSFVGLAWAARTKDGVTDIYATTSADGGRSFRAPARVNQAAGDASVSGEQPPRIALIPRRGGDPAVTVMWTARSPAGTRLATARSTDGGHSFGAAELVPGSDASGNRGWESMAVTAKGDVMALWLDHRESPARPSAGPPVSGGHQHGAASPRASGDGVARAQLSQIFFANLQDPGSTRSLAHGVCYCCKTSMATGPDGSIVAVWRHVYPGNVRDIALARSSDGGRTFAPPVRVSDDNWVLDGCPENGPAVAVDAANAIHVVWPTLIQEATGTEPGLALFYSTSRDGRRFTSRQRIPTEGVPRHPQIALGGPGTIVVAWDEQSKGARRIALARGTPEGKGQVGFVRESVTDQGATYPVVATLPDAAIVAWTSGGSGGDTVLRVERRPAAQ